MCVKTIMQRAYMAIFLAYCLGKYDLVTESAFIHPEALLTLQKKTMDLLKCRPRFLSLATVDILARIVLYCWGAVLCIVGGLAGHWLLPIRCQ